MKIRLFNDFHNTEVSIMVSPGKPLSAYQIRKIRRTLCGMDDCCCGNDLDMRGPQMVEFDMQFRPILTKTLQEG